MRKVIANIIQLCFLQLFLLSCQLAPKHGPLIASMESSDINIRVSKEVVQAGLNALLSPSNANFTIKSMDIVEMGNRKFLKVIGTTNEICMVALEED